MSGQSYAGRPEDPTTATGEPQPGLSRRSVLRGVAGASAAGLAAAAVAGTAGPALAAATSASSRTHDAKAAASDAATSEPVVVHMRDARSGEMDVFAGTSHTRLRDPDLAARLARAIR
jgi:hypothetical protein